MNKQDMKKVEEALKLLRTANDLLEPLAEAEQEKFDNMTEGLQQGENGQRIESWANALASAQESASAAIDAIEGEM